ncbi:hypothetical protein B0H13DRAFT_2117551 [Mycena leptocephala]|nr:hypothetical protein B0H13DRAFT_2117551 [Mycena leptocephala]
MSWQLPICSKKALTITTTASSPSLSVARGAVERPQRNAVAQLQPMFTAQGDRLRLFENATGATLGEFHRGVQTLLARDHAAAPTPVSVPAVPTPVAERPFAPPLTAVPAMLAPPIAAHPVTATPSVFPQAPAAPVPTGAMPVADMQSFFTAVLSAVLATKRGHEDDEVQDGRNMRYHSNTATPVASTSTAFAVHDAPIDAPNAPDAPTRSTNPAHELVFGPRTSTPSVGPSSPRA